MGCYRSVSIYRGLLHLWMFWAERSQYDFLNSLPHIFNVKMKSSILSLIAVASTASAHYTFPQFIAAGKTGGLWESVRTSTPYNSYVSNIIS
jgi:hypothetical protein